MTVDGGSGNPVNSARYRFLVVIPCFNQARFLEAALQSLTDQTFDSFEVVVVDDGSRDNPGLVFDAWHARQAPALQSASTLIKTANRGQLEAILTGIRGSDAEWVALLDADDTFVPGKLEAINGLISQSEPGTTLIQHKLAVIDTTGRLTGEVRPKRAQLSGVNSSGDQRHRSREVFTAASGMVLRRRSILHAARMGAVPFKFAADAYLAFAAANLGGVTGTNEPLGCYRMQPNGQYLTRILEQKGLAQQVAFQELLETRFLEPEDRANSYFLRNRYALLKLTGQSAEAIGVLRSLLYATLIDNNFSVYERMALMTFWAMTACMPGRVFSVAWKKFQLRQTGWNRVEGESPTKTLEERPACDK